MKAKEYSGQLKARFDIECGMCAFHSVEGIGDGVYGVARTKTEAKKVLERAGWHFTRAWGWICPKCEKFGSSGVVPAPPL